MKQFFKSLLPVAIFLISAGATLVTLYSIIGYGQRGVAVNILIGAGIIFASLSVGLILTGIAGKFLGFTPSKRTIKDFFKRS